jgi:hypothetical protein
MGFGTGLTSGQALQSHRLHELLRLAPGEVPVCCINLGTVSKHKPSSRIRPEPAAILTSL